MYDLFLLRGRGIEGMLGISPFEADEFQTFNNPTEADFSGDKKNSILPFQSEALKDKTEKMKAGPTNKFLGLELAPALVALGFIAFGLVCFLLVAFLVD